MKRLTADVDEPPGLDHSLALLVCNYFLTYKSYRRPIRIDLVASKADGSLATRHLSTTETCSNLLDRRNNVQEHVQ